jgi:hypothetical protein
LDDLLQCTWRQREVQDRRSRIVELAHAAGECTPLLDSFRTVLP